MSTIALIIYAGLLLAGVITITIILIKEMKNDRDV